MKHKTIVNFFGPGRACGGRPWPPPPPGAPWPPMGGRLWLWPLAGVALGPRGGPGCYLLPPTSHLLLSVPPTSHLLPPTSPPTSHLLPPTSHLLPPTSHLLPPTSYLLLLTSHLPLPPLLISMMYREFTRASEYKAELASHRLRPHTLVAPHTLHPRVASLLACRGELALVGISEVAPHTVQPDLDTCSVFGRCRRLQPIGCTPLVAPHKFHGNCVGRH